MTERNSTLADADMTLKTTPRRSDLKQTTSPVEYIVEKLR